MAARGAGVQAMNSLPLRLRGSTLGALNVFRHEQGALSAEEAEAAQSFADMATLVVVHHRAVGNPARVTTYLQDALNQRVAIEVAKGVLMDVCGVTAGQASAMLLTHAREHGRRLGEVAAGVIEGGPEREAVAGTAPAV